VIEDVEELGSELKRRLLCEMKVFVSNEIDILHRRTGHVISTFIAERVRSRQVKGRNIEPFKPALRETAIRIAHYLRPLASTAEISDIA
jgi:hypothetical protein